MAKLVLQPNPTFTAPVLIPVPGGKPVAVSFTFRHRGRVALEEHQKYIDAVLVKLRDESTTRSEALELDIEVVMKSATAWEMDDPFNEESLRTLLENYHGAAAAIYATYMRELLQAKAGN